MVAAPLVCQLLVNGFYLGVLLGGVKCMLSVFFRNVIGIFSERRVCVTLRYTWLILGFINILCFALRYTWLIINILL